MASLPLIRTTKPGIYRVLSSATTDYTIPIPAGAVGCIVWFETSTTNAALVGGRIGMDPTDTAITGITGTDDNLGYHPAMPVQYEFGKPAYQGGGSKPDPKFIHVASSTAGVVVRGTFLYDVDGKA